uniref:Uncharacterized protein n=1 Tax=Arundo donax TaxID=35708 RepID=A0A0A8YB03_ARUDO
MYNEDIDRNAKFEIDKIEVQRGKSIVQYSIGEIEEKSAER